VANDSLAAGFLTPAPSPAALYENALDAVLHDLVVGITGIDGSLVRPRWQPIPPIQPDFGTPWVALGTTRIERDTFAAIVHTHEADGEDELSRTEMAYILVSCYGPSAHNLAALICDSLQISQNRDTLRAHDASVVETSEASSVPAIQNEKWVKRVDFTITLRRRVSRVYGVRHVLTAGVDIDNEHYHTVISTTTP
jgi:hypothetical protein